MRNFLPPFLCLVHADLAPGFDSVLNFCGDLLAWTNTSDELCALVDCATGKIVEVPIEKSEEFRGGWYAKHWLLSWKISPIQGV